MPLTDLFFGLGGVIVGSSLTNYFDIRKARKKMALDLHQEWNGTEMSIHRRKAYRLVNTYPTTLFDQFVEEHDDASISLFVVMRFFQRIYHVVNNQQANVSLMHDLFAEMYYDWYYQHLENGITSLRGDISKDLVNLMKWFKTQVSFVDDQEWMMKYQEKKRLRIEKINAK
jgi:hypothetical protein